MSIIRTALSLSLVAVAASLAACTTAGNDDVKSGDQAVNAGDCDGTGTWAIKIETPVTWTNSLVVTGGTGTVTNWLRSSRVQTGTDIVDTASICGVLTPDYASSAVFGSEKFGVRFPDALFESGALPSFDITGSLDSTAPGASFSTQPAAALVGATMANAASDPWPANGSTLTTADTDGDGKLGISVDTATDAGYKNPPLNPIRSARANRIYTAFRQVLSSTQGTVTTCNRVDGTGTVATIAGKPAIDQHVLGCRREDGTECSASEFKLLDSAAPVYKPTGDAVITMVRIPAASSCSDIRAIDFASATGDEP